MQSDQVTVVVGELHARAGAIDTSASCVAHRDVPGRPRVAQSSRANASWPQISAKKKWPKTSVSVEGSHDSVAHCHG